MKKREKMIQLKHVSKKIKKQLILDDISVQLKNGRCYGFTGYNGCGKTMLLRAICGFLSVDSGQIIIDDKELGKDIDFIQDAGILIGEADFLNSRSGFENLEILAQIRNKIKSEDIVNFMNSMGILEEKDKKVRYYSLGMKQRLRLTQVFMENPSVLVLDEPFNALDKAGVKKIQDLLVLEKKKGNLLLLTSHDQSKIELLCDKVFEIENGRIISERGHD